MSQKIIASWSNPTHDRDGNAYGEADHAAYLLSLDGGAAFTLPLVWGTNFDLGTLPAVQALNSGTHSATIASLSKKGVVGVPSAATFSVSPTPAAVGNFSITSS